MKHVMYTDRQGYKQRRLVRDNDTEEDAQYGVPAGPPDLRQLDMGEILREANNALADLEIWTLKDLQKSNVSLTAATNVFKRALVNLYREEA